MATDILIESHASFAEEAWEVLAEVKRKPLYSFTDLSKIEPEVRILQHKDTRELRVDVFGCEGGLKVTYTNGGMRETLGARARWFRDIICRRGHQPVRVRFMSAGESHHMELQS